MTDPGDTHVSAAGVVSGLSYKHGVGYLVGVFCPTRSRG
jgi:hypothetical protein